MVKYVKEFAGGTFFRVVFSGLLKATGEPVKKFQGSASDPKSTFSTTDSETSSPVKTPGSEKSATPKTPRKMFFPKFSRSTGSSDGSPTGTNEFGFEGPVTPMTRKKVRIESSSWGILYRAFLQMAQLLQGNEARMIFS